VARNLHLSKVSIHRVTDEAEYASVDALVESLNTARATWNVPVGKYVRDLVEGRVDSVSFTKDKPYYYFFGRRFEKSLSITIKEAERIIEFSIPLHEAEKILTA